MNTLSSKLDPAKERIRRDSWRNYPKPSTQGKREKLREVKILGCV